MKNLVRSSSLAHMRRIVFAIGLLTAIGEAPHVCVAAEDSATTQPSSSAGETSRTASGSDRTTATSSPSDEISTPSVDHELISELIVKYTNEERKKAGLNPVQSDKALARLAAKHSRDMATRGYFSHASKREDVPDVAFDDRVSLEKLGYQRTGENIALQPIVQSKQIRTTRSSSGEVSRDITRDFSTYDELARKTVEGWMNSPGHRKNILTPEFNLIGIGVGIGEREGTPYAYITQDFGQK